MKRLLVGFALHRNDGIGRQRQPLALQIFLQQRFGVLALRLHIDCFQIGNIQFQHSLLRVAETGIQQDRAEQRFQRIRQYRRAAETAALQLALAQPQMAAEIELLRKQGERLFPDQAGAQARQIALAQLRIIAVQVFGNHAAEHAVAQKFHAFVVFGRIASMGQCALQQLRLPEHMAEFLAQHIAGHGVLRAPSGLICRHCWG